jgi:hypothetical protein
MDGLTRSIVNGDLPSAQMDNFAIQVSPQFHMNLLAACFASYLSVPEIPTLTLKCLLFDFVLSHFTTA